MVSLDKCSGSSLLGCDELSDLLLLNSALMMGLVNFSAGCMQTLQHMSILRKAQRISLLVSV